MRTAFLVCALLAGCATSSTQDDQSLSVADHGRTLVTNPGQVVDLLLPSNPSTGYQWTVIEAPNPLVVRVLSSQYEAPALDAPRVGAPGVQHWRLQAAGQGGTKIKLAYARPTSSGPAEREYELAFMVE
jgi:inhibitor of cysteine peptidase